MSIPRGAEFHERIASKWEAGYARAGFKHRLKLFNSILDRSVMNGQLWLDLGCGSGVLTRELIKRGARVVVLDGSPSMLEEARRSLDVDDTTAGVLVTYRQGDAQDLSWSEPCAFDGVLCSSVIEYVADQDELIRQVIRVLKENGSLIVSMPSTRSPTRALQKVLRHGLKVLGIDKYTYLRVSRFEIDPSGVAEWLKAAGMTVNRISKYDPVLPKYLLKIFRPALLVCEARKFKSGNKSRL